MQAKKKQRVHQALVARTDFKERGRGENVGRGKRVSESFHVQDQTEPQDEPALMRSPRTTPERKNSLCIRRNFGAAQEQGCETCRMVRGRGHRGSQHANATEFSRSESRNLLNWMLAATVSVKVALESACIMLLGFRVWLLGLQVAWSAISIRTCCALSSSPSAPAPKSPAQKRRRHARRGSRRSRHRHRACCAVSCVETAPPTCGKGFECSGSISLEHYLHDHPYCFASLVVAAAACAAVFAAAAAACAAFVRAMSACIAIEE